MTYSAVIHPPGRLSLNHGGTSRKTEAVHSSTVFPCCHSTDPAGACVKPRVIFTERSWSAARPSCRMAGDYSGPAAADEGVFAHASTRQVPITRNGVGGIREESGFMPDLASVAERLRVIQRAHR